MTRLEAIRCKYLKAHSLVGFLKCLQFHNFFVRPNVDSDHAWAKSKINALFNSLPSRGGHWGVPNTAIPQKITTNTVIPQKISANIAIPHRKSMKYRNRKTWYNLFARQCLKYIFHGKENKQHPFYVKSTWEPPVHSAVAKAI